MQVLKQSFYHQDLPVVFNNMFNVAEAAHDLIIVSRISFYGPPAISFLTESHV